jgi:hypothetical protein
VVTLGEITKVLEGELPVDPFKEYVGFVRLEGFGADNTRVAPLQILCDFE